MGGRVCGILGYQSPTVQDTFHALHQLSERTQQVSQQRLDRENFLYTYLSLSLFCVDKNLVKAGISPLTNLFSSVRNQQVGFVWSPILNSVLHPYLWRGLHCQVQLVGRTHSLKNLRFRCLFKFSSVNISF